MSGPNRDVRDAYGIEELTINISIKDGKIIAESKSGPKSGSVELAIDNSTARLELKGAGSDRATAKFTGPELTNFRTMIDATLSRLMAGEDTSALDRDVITSGYRPLEKMDEDFCVSFELETLRRLGLITDEGEIAGGRRQVQCTVLGNGTAILNLRPEAD